jgi:hypothetical protein
VRPLDANRAAADTALEVVVGSPVIRRVIVTVAAGAVPSVLRVVRLAEPRCLD